MFFVLLFIGLIAGQCSGGAQASAADLKRKIQALSAPREEETPIRRQQALRVEDDIGRFIVHQLQNQPSIMQCDLQKQLRDLFGDLYPVDCQQEKIVRVNFFL